MDRAVNEYNIRRQFQGQVRRAINGYANNDNDDRYTGTINSVTITNSNCRRTDNNVISNNSNNNNFTESEQGKADKNLNILSNDLNSKNSSNNNKGDNNTNNNNSSEKDSISVIISKNIKSISDIANGGPSPKPNEEKPSRQEPDVVPLKNRSTESVDEKPCSSTSASASTSESTLIPEGTADVNELEELSFGDPRQNHVFQVLTGVQHLRSGDKYADLVVKIQDQEFSCHRFIVATSSPYLRDMIEEVSPGVSDGGDCDGGVCRQQQQQQREQQQQEEQQHKVHSDGANRKEGRDDVDTNNTKNRTLETNGSNTVTVNSKDSSAEKDKNALGSKGVIVLKGIQPDIFAKVLDFMYCVFDDVINEDNAMELLLAADTLQLTYLRRTCASFITENLSMKNVFDVISLWDSGFASLFETKVVRRAHQVIRENFSQVNSLPEFLALNRHHMIPLVADSMLHAHAEIDVIQALLRWVRVRPEERTADMTLMMQHIRFPLMTSRDLEKLKEIPLLKENSLAMALLEESKAYGNMDYTDRLGWPRHNCISRCLFPARDFIIWTADRDKGLHFYSIIDGHHNKVTSFGELTKPSAGGVAFDSTSSVCCYGDKIFFTGGEFNTDMTWSVDTGTGEVKVHAKMPRGRKFHSMVASRGCIYCIGGQDKRGYTVLECVDAYIIDKDVWVKVGHLSVPAFNMAAVTSGGAIYLVGGIDNSGQPLRQIQCFVALRSGLYSAFKIDVPNMPPSLLSARAVTSGLDGIVYIVCGHGEVYRFEPEKRQLTHLATLKNLSENPRVRFGLAHVGGCLVVIGGHQLGHAVREPIRSVCLDIATKTEVRDYSPLLPGDIVNTCTAAKLNTNILNLFNE